MPTSTTWLDVPGRIVMSVLFLVSGYGKLANVTATQSYMEAFHVPGILIWPAAGWELGAGLLLAAGLFTRPLAIGLACWCVLTAAIFHTVFADQNQLFHFFKNLTMAGAFALIASHGINGAKLARRRAAGLSDVTRYGERKHR